MKSIVQMAKDLDISSSTIREYLSRFEEFFPDPVENQGVKEYPPEAEDLIKQIYGYYQGSGMTKEQIREKLKGASGSDSGEAPAANMVAAAPMDMARFDALGEKLDRLIDSVETLTEALTGAPVESLKGVRKQAGNNRKLDEINEQITDIIELSQGGEAADDTVEKNVTEADGTVVFSFGLLTQNAQDSINFAKAHKKPWLHIDLETEQNPSRVLRKWLPQFNIKVLNVVGKSASKIPGLKKSMNDIIAMVLNG